MDFETLILLVVIYVIISQIAHYVVFTLYAKKKSVSRQAAFIAGFMSHFLGYLTGSVVAVSIAFQIDDLVGKIAIGLLIFANLILLLQLPAKVMGWMDVAHQREAAK